MNNNGYGTYISNSYGLYIPNTVSISVDGIYNDIDEPILTIHGKNEFLYNLYKKYRKCNGLILSITCSCEKVYNYYSIENIPLRDTKCGCGITLIKFLPKSNNLYGLTRVSFGDVDGYNISKIQKIQKWWRKYLLSQFSSSLKSSSNKTL